MIEMTYIKPKEMAQRLEIAPERVSVYAKEIENTRRYKFGKTPMGSFLFVQKDEKILREYAQLVQFFEKKSAVLEMIHYKLDQMEPEPQLPAWFKRLKNIKHFKR